MLFAAYFSIDRPSQTDEPGHGVAFLLVNAETPDAAGKAFYKKLGSLNRKDTFPTPCQFTLHSMVAFEELPLGGVLTHFDWFFHGPTASLGASTPHQKIKRLKTFCFTSEPGREDEDESSPVFIAFEKRGVLGRIETVSSTDGATRMTESLHHGKPRRPQLNATDF